MSDKNKGIDLKEVEIDTTNPLSKGVSYEAFLKNVKGKDTIDTLLDKNNIDKDIANWIKRELTIYKKGK